MVFVQQKHPGLFARIRNGWQSWRIHRKGLAELCSSAEVDFIARDLSLSRHDLQAMAAKWPGGSDLLNHRMATLRLDPEKLSVSELGVFRDAERVCTVCGSKNQCKHDLAKHPTSGDWRKYCPNVDTLDAFWDARWLPVAKTRK